MGFYHIVQEGETVRDLAMTYGVSPDEILSHPNNRGLSGRTVDVLAAGDRVWVPVDEPTPIIQSRGAPVHTGRSYQFGAGQLRDIEVQWLDHRGSAFANWNWELRFGGRTLTGRLDGDGVLRARVPVEHRLVEVKIEESSVAALRDFIRTGVPGIDTGRSNGRDHWQDWQDSDRRATHFEASLSIGSLEPHTTDTGMIRRLANLAYYFGPQTPDEINQSPELRARLDRGILRFRRHQQLTGTQALLDGPERERLRDVHLGVAPFRRGPNPALMHASSPYHIAPTQRNVLRRPSATQELGVAGVGMYMRANFALWYPTALVTQNLDWVCANVRHHDRPNNRSAPQQAYLRDLSAQGIAVTCFDWTPSLAGWNADLDLAVEYSASVGAHAFVMNVEKSFGEGPGALRQRNAAAYAGRVRALSFGRRMSVGFSSFGLTRSGVPFNEFISRSAFVMPQTYDHNHGLDPNYCENSAKLYASAGARVFSFGIGLHLIDPIRSRTLLQLEQHLGTFPDFVDSVTAWPVAGDVSADRFERLRSWWDSR